MEERGQAAEGRSVQHHPLVRGGPPGEPPPPLTATRLAAAAPDIFPVSTHLATACLLIFKYFSSPHFLILSPRIGIFQPSPCIRISLWSFVKMQIPGSRLHPRRHTVGLVRPEDVDLQELTESRPHHCDWASVLASLLAFPFQYS